MPEEITCKVSHIYVGLGIIRKHILYHQLHKGFSQLYSVIYQYISI